MARWIPQLFSQLRHFTAASGCQRRPDDVITWTRDHFRFRYVQLLDGCQSRGTSLTTAADDVIRRTYGRRTGSQITGSHVNSRIRRFQRPPDAAVGGTDDVILPVTWSQSFSVDRNGVDMWTEFRVDSTSGKLWGGHGCRRRFARESGCTEQSRLQTTTQARQQTSWRLVFRRRSLFRHQWWRHNTLPAGSLLATRRTLQQTNFRCYWKQSGSRWSAQQTQISFTYYTVVGKYLLAHLYNSLLCLISIPGSRYVYKKRWVP